MAFDFENWDKRVRRDLRWRRSEVDHRWKKNEDYVRNETKDRLGNKATFKGNLVREFEKVIYHRVVNKAPVIKVRSADTEYSSHANDLEVVANDLSRIVRMKDALRQATMFSTYSMGWLEVGHPYAAWGLNPNQYSGINRNISDPTSLESQWEEVDPNLAAAQGIDLQRVGLLDYDPNEFMTDVGKEPSPVFNDSGIAFPYLTYVNGLHMVTPKDVENYLDGDYVARLRPVTLDELKTMTGVTPKNKGISREYWDLFPGFDFEYLGDESVLIVECWVKRDRLDSKYNNWYAAWVIGEPGDVLRDMANPWGGMTPYTPVKLTKMGKFLERTVVDDIVPVSDMYSMALKAIDQDMIESMNGKVVADQTANIKDDDAKKLLNPSYRGLIKVNRKEGISVERGPGLDVNKIQYVRFLREIAQQSTATSEIDKGQAVKKISARQTSALVEATDQIINGMRELVSESAEESITKLMFILGIFHGKKRQYKYGARVVTFDHGQHDFTTSLIYNIDVKDMGPDPSAEDKMMLMQFIRTVSMNPELSAQYQWQKVATEVARIFGWAPDSVKQPQMEMPQPDLQDLSPMEGRQVLQRDVNPNPGRGPTDQADSLQAPSTSNALSGLARSI